MTADRCELTADSVYVLRFVIHFVTFSPLGKGAGG